MIKVRHFDFLSLLSWSYDGNEPQGVSKTRFEVTSIFCGGAVCVCVCLGGGGAGGCRMKVSKEEIHDNSALSCKY